jgi:FixJ family two-component response regulator
MPGMKGMDLLRLRAPFPRTRLKIMMTAFADLPTVMEAINRADAFRFIVKPWKNEN